MKKRTYPTATNKTIRLAQLVTTTTVHHHAYAEASKLSSQIK